MTYRTVEPADVDAYLGALGPDDLAGDMSDMDVCVVSQTIRSMFPDATHASCGFYYGTAIVDGRSIELDISPPVRDFIHDCERTAANTDDPRITASEARSLRPWA